MLILFVLVAQEGRENGPGLGKFPFSPQADYIKGVTEML